MYADVGDLSIYHEVHGEGRPTLLMHGAYMSIDAWGPLMSGLAEDRQVIAFEARGHGRTADAEGPITYEGMADDAAGLLDALGIEEADVVGYSMGAGTGVQFAIRHPQRVRKLVAASASYQYEGMHASAIEMFPSLSIEMFLGTEMETEYRRLSPHPDRFPELFEKLKTLDTTPFDWEEDVRGITTPTLIVVGDSDVVRVDHAVKMFELLGGNVMGDLGESPQSQLAVLPGTNHYMPPGSGVLDRHQWLLAVIRPFLDG